MPPQNLDDILKATGQPGDSAPVDSSNPVAAAPSSSSSLQPTTLTNPQHIGTLDSVLQQTGQPEEVPQDVQKKQGMIEQLKQEVAGPGTVLGEAPEAGAGVRRMLQGDIVGGAKQAAQGYKKMAGASLTKGSEQIDAQKHPILKAGLEFAEGMTSPINLGMVAASGGLGMIDSAAKVYMVHQLANAGLTSEQIMSLYNNFPEIKKAWDAGDSSKVLYEGTHMLLSGALAIAGAQDMAGKPMEAATEGERALIQKGKEAVGGAATAVKEAPGKVAARVKGALAAPEAEVKSNPVEDLKAAFPPSKTNPYNENAPQVAYNALAAEHKLNTIHDPQEAAEALQNQISQAENKVMDQAIKQVPDEPISKRGQPVSVWDEVQNELQSRKIAKEGFVPDAMKELEKFGIKKGQQITVSDADRIRRQLNDETTSIEKKPEYQQVRIENVDPKYAALQVAKDVLRDGVYDTIDAHGLDKGVTARDFRRDIIGNLISFRNAMLDKALGPDQQVKGTAPEVPKESLTRKVARGATQGAIPAVAAGAGYATGHPALGAAAAGGSVPVSIAAGEKLFPKPEVPEDLTRSELLDRALNHPEADKFVTETPEEQQIRGNIQQPQVPAARGQGEIPFGPPEIFGENQGEVSPLEMRSEQLEKISTYINKLRETIENPTATSVEKDAAQHQLELVFGGKIPEGFKRPKEQGAASPAPKLLEAQSRFEAPGEIKSRTGLDAKAILNHELAHAALAHMAGLEPLDIISNKHMEAGPTTIAAVRIGWPADMLKREDGTIEPRALKERLPDVLATYMAGAAANELYDGIKYEDNKSLKGDIQEVENTLDLLGLSAEEKDRFIEWGMTRAKATLQDPDVEDLINEFSDTRERGLPASHHYSAARMLEFRDRLDKLGGRYANNPEGTNVNNPEYGQTEQPAREKQPTAVHTGEVAEAERTRSQVTPNEQTTGVHDAVIKQAGAVPGGIQKGDTELDIPDLALFHDPETGSTLALPVDKVTPEAITQAMEKSRAQFAAFKK